MGKQGTLKRAYLGREIAVGIAIDIQFTSVTVYESNKIKNNIKYLPR